MDSKQSEVTLWRYMDMAKFVSLLSTQALYLPAANTFNDKFEGTVNQATFDVYRKMIRSSLENQGRSGPGEFVRVRVRGLWLEILVTPEDPTIGLHRTLQALRARSYVSCWHASDHESEAMWKLYLADPLQGIAIKTTVARLNSALPDGLNIQPVEYMDYASPVVMEYLTEPFFRKRLAFQHEREWRIVDQRLPEPQLRVDGASTVSIEGEAPSAVSIKPLVPLSELVLEARLAPFADPWIAQVYRDLLARFNTAIPLLESDLARVPFDPER